MHVSKLLLKMQEANWDKFVVQYTKYQIRCPFWRCVRCVCCVRCVTCVVLVGNYALV